jgi:hypothetical protein
MQVNQLIIAGIVTTPELFVQNSMEVLTEIQRSTDEQHLFADTEERLIGEAETLATAMTNVPHMLHLDVAPQAQTRDSVVSLASITDCLPTSYTGLNTDTTISLGNFDRVDRLDMQSSSQADVHLHLGSLEVRAAVLSDGTDPLVHGTNPPLDYDSLWCGTNRLTQLELLEDIRARISGMNSRLRVDGLTPTGAQLIILASLLKRRVNALPFVGFDLSLPTIGRSVSETFPTVAERAGQVPTLMVNIKANSDRARIHFGTSQGTQSSGFGFGVSVGMSA